MKYGIIFGGQSYEHEVSIVSAIAMKNALAGRDLTFIFCDPNRRFFVVEEGNMTASFFQRHFGHIKSGAGASDVALSSQSSYNKVLKEVSIGDRGFYASGMFSKNRLDVDVYINLVHGCDGEDGKLASLLEFFSIPMIGPRLEASVLSYNKILTKYLAKLVGVKTIGFQILKRTSLPAFNYPIIIKPARLGSSIGIGIVNKDSELDYTMDKVFDLDHEAIVEPYVQNIKEYNLAGCKINGEIVFSNIEEPVKEGFLDFGRKYLDFSRHNKVEPAKVGATLTDKMKDAFTKIYNSGFDGALIRCDFFEVNNEIYLNEINPNPGSLANYLFDDFPKVIDGLAASLPTYKTIPVNYELLTKLSANK